MPPAAQLPARSACRYMIREVRGEAVLEKIRPVVKRPHGRCTLASISSAYQMLALVRPIAPCKAFPTCVRSHAWAGSLSCLRCQAKITGVAGNSIGTRRVSRPSASQSGLHRVSAMMAMTSVCATTASADDAVGRDATTLRSSPWAASASSTASRRRPRRDMVTWSTRAKRLAVRAPRANG